MALASEFGKGFISDGAEGKAIIFDLQTFKVTGEAKADKDADSIIYDPFSKRVFVMNGDPHSSTVIDAKNGSVAGTIDLGGGPEFAVADGKGAVYVNLEDKNELVGIDSQSLKIKWRWPLAPAGTPTALAMDVQHHRLFSAGRNPQMLVVLDSDSGKVLQSFPISAGADAAAYEPETGLVFVSTRDGMVQFHIGELLTKLDRTWLDSVEDRRMQIVPMNGDVAGAILLFPRIAERQLEQDLPGIPFSTGEGVRVDADLTQPMLRVEMAQHLHDIRRNMNAGAYPLKRASLFVKSNLETLALQQGSRSGTSKPSPDDGNAGLALHVRPFC